MLGLVAQQELELSIFKETLENMANFDIVLETETIAQEQAIEKYGNYINFRSGMTN